MAKLTKQKAAQMLHDKTAHGKPLTDKQRKYFGAVANGKKGIKVDPMGYWNPENQGKPVIIPSDQITMHGVDFPVLGVADNGKQMMMYPYQNYDFQGAKYVTEYPLAQDGKQLPWYMKRQQGDNTYVQTTPVNNAYTQGKNLTQLHREDFVNNLNKSKQSRNRVKVESPRIKTTQQAEADQQTVDFLNRESGYNTPIGNFQEAHKTSLDRAQERMIQNADMLGVTMPIGESAYALGKDLLKTIPKSSQQITRGFIDWADTPGFMERNPQFNPRKYENWVKSKTDFSAPFDPNLRSSESRNLFTKFENYDPENLNSESGADWMRQWYSNPDFQRRYVAAPGKYVVEESDMQESILNLLNKYKPKNYIDLLKDKGIGEYSLLSPLTGGVSYGAPESIYINRSKYFPFNKKGLESVRTHELTHLIERNGTKFSDLDEQRLLEPFGIKNTDEIPQKKGLIQSMFRENPGYYLEPTEIHARMNQARFELGLSPEDVFTEEMFNTISNKNNWNGMGKYIKDKNKFIDLMNNFWAVPPTIIGGAAALENKQYGGKIDNMQQAKSGIHIKESKKGTFTAAAKKHGKGVQEFARQVLANKENYSPAMVKKANFARNAAKWKHEEGGAIYSKPSIGGGQFLPIQDSEHYAQYIPIAENGHFIREGNSNYFLKDIYSGLEEMRTGGQLRWNQAQDGLNIYNPQSEYLWNANPNPIIPITPRQNQVQEADLAMDNNMFIGSTINPVKLDMNLKTDLGKMAMQSPTAPNILQRAPEAKRPVPNPEKQPGWTTAQKLIAGLAIADRFIPERDPIRSNAPKMENTLYAPWNTPSYGRGSQAIAKHGLQIHGDYNMDDITRMEQGGELNIHWGGEAEPISYNPIDGQETVLFNGASHDNGGIGIDFQGNPVEVQGGEPAMKDEQGNLNILGGMQVPGQKYTFQTMGKKIAKQENKYTKQLDKGSEFVNKSDLNNRFDILSMNTGKAMMAGATQKLKELSEKKQDIIALQNSILDTAKELNLDPNALSKGKLRKGKDQKTAQWGALMNAFGPVRGNTVNPVVYNHLSDLYNKAKAFEGKGKNQAVLDFQKEYHRLVPQFAHQVLESEPVTNYGKQTGKSNKELTSNEDQIFGKRTVRYMQELEKYKPKPYNSTITPAQPKKQDLKDLHQDYKDKQLEYTPSTYPLGSAAQDLAFYQVAPELAAFATNRVRPVPAFGIQQDLYQPYKISMQDQRNANAATFRAMQEQLGYNPTAMSTLAAQKYQADQQSLADEFRTNQGIEADVINKNLGIVNETRNKNLQLQADQWMKQEMAKANTRKEDLGILSSISNKVGQNKREQTQIKLWENMFKYRPNSNWQMQWQGGDADLFAGITPLVTEKRTKVTEKDGDKTTQTTTTEKANGGIAKAVKRMGKYNSLG